MGDSSTNFKHNWVSFATIQSNRKTMIEKAIVLQGIEKFKIVQQS